MSRLNKTTIISSSLILIFSLLVYIFAWSPILTVSSVQISGAPTAESERTILKASGITVGEKLARIETRSIEERLKTFAWIKRVHLTRNWINGDVSVSISPRIPKAYFNGRTMDASGAIFDLPGFTGGDLPKVSGASAPLGVAAVSLFKGLPLDFRSGITSLKATNESNFSIAMKYEGRDLQIKWGSPEKSSLKVEVFNALMELQENKKIRRLDLSAPHAPIVK